VLAALAPKAGDLPFVGLDIILDGPRSVPGSFLEAAGDKVANAYGVFDAGIDPVLGPRVEAAFQAAYGRPAGGFVLGAHACATVILDAVDRLDRSNLAGPADWREAIRAEVTAPGRRYETAIGTIGFDANGDATPQRVSIYRADATAGDWTFSQMLELPSGG
jgi:ABC-type branched-subunit amino acid transport system substrate-binding protein